MSFEKLGLIEPILRALDTEGYTMPTPIQEKSIPIILKGQDLLGCAQTGTGKTAAFAIPIIQQLHLHPGDDRSIRKIKALIVTPTRELAIQIGDSFAAYGRHTKLRYTVVFGGVPQSAQVNALRNGVDVLIATPGRLLDLISQGYIRLNDVSIFVLDEADRMLDMGFVHDVKKLIKMIPVKRQSLFFSATMPDSIMALASTILTNPEKVEVTPISSTAETIQQAIYFVDQARKYELLVHLLKDPGIITALVFTRTKHGADKVVKMLTRFNVKAEAIHGNKSQNARQKALSNFKDHITRVLVATDIAARGIDIDELSYVINFEIPNIPETYVHRIGRTGRAGANGKAISFCDVEERPFLRDIQKLISIQIPVEDNHPFPAENTVAENPAKPKAQIQRGNGNHNRPRPATTDSTGRPATSAPITATSKPQKKWSWRGTTR
ncbi:MAG: DEAD/DEAH box helicase [Saprospiraceae bacterium]|nr:DEAD/DEAH box helicase [Saprospiraceae bacterium]